MADKPLNIYTSNVPAPLIFPSIFEARAFKNKKTGKDKGDPKYSAGFLLDPVKNKADIDGIKAICVSAARAEWPGVDLKTLKFPFESGDKRIEKFKAGLEKDGKSYEGQRDFEAGKFVITARSKFQPRLGGLVNGKIVDFEDDAAKARAKPTFYFGAECFYEINFVAYEAVNEGSNGVTAYINQVVSLNRGEKLTKGGGQSAAETFKDYLGAAVSEDPTGGGADNGLDDDIPF